MAIDARGINDLVLPYIRVSLVALDGDISGVRIQYIQGQYDHAVATAFFMECMPVNTALRQRLTAERVLSALTHRMLDGGLGDIVYGQVQDMAYAVLTLTVRLYLRVLAAYRIGLAVVVPYIRLARTDRCGLLVGVDILIDIRRDDRVATVHRMIAEFIRTRLVDDLTAIGLRESEEGNALREGISRMNRHMQNEDRIHSACCVLQRVAVDTRIAVVLAVTP